MDASQKFLDAAMQRGIYRSAHHIYLGCGNFPMEGRRAHYDLVVSAGVWLTGHIPKEGIPEVIDCMKPGGLWIFALRSQYLAMDEPMGYAAKFAEEEAAGRVTLVQKSTFTRGRKPTD